jgi:hypothetical protein
MAATDPADGEASPVLFRVLSVACLHGGNFLAAQGNSFFGARPPSHSAPRIAYGYRIGSGGSPGPRHAAPRLSHAPAPPHPLARASRFPPCWRTAATEVWPCSRLPVVVCGIRTWRRTATMRQARRSGSAVHNPRYTRMAWLADCSPHYTRGTGSRCCNARLSIFPSTRSPEGPIASPAGNYRQSG